MQTIQTMQTMQTIQTMQTMQTTQAPRKLTLAPFQPKKQITYDERQRFLTTEHPDNRFYEQMSIHGIPMGMPITMADPYMSYMGTINRTPIYIGSAANASNREYLEFKGIDAIACITMEEPVLKKCDDITFLHIPIEDTQSVNIKDYFPKFVEFMNEQIESNKTGILIHCQYGISRSVTLYAYFHMKHFGVSCDVALEHIRSSRQQASPNFGFHCQLRNYRE
jgi:hypothetical protein